MRKRIPTLLLIACAASAHAEPKLLLNKAGSRLEVRAEADRKAARLELRLHSSRNEKISRFTDASPLNPRPRTAWTVDRDTWYPVVDVELETGMEAVAMFDPAPQTFYTVNGMFYRERKPLASKVAIPLDRLERWENSVFVESAAARLRSFHIRHVLPATSGKVSHVYRLLSDNWSGTVSLHEVDAEGNGRELARAGVDGPAKRPETLFGAGPLDRGRLVQSLAATVGYTLRSQNRDPRSPMRGGLFLFYDLDASLYRTSHWMWGWGPSVKLLLDAASVPALASQFGTERLRRTANEIGRASLQFDPRSGPADGVPISRWDRSITYDYGHVKAITPSDANFLSGWAWIPLYEATGDKRYLEAARTLALATDRIAGQFGLIPQNYWPDTETWSDFTLDESGFGTEGLAELYRVTRDNQYRELGRRYIEEHLAKLQRDDGIWERMWLRSKHSATPTLHNTRAAGWAMEGLLAAHRMMPGGKYLGLARRMAEHLLQAQQPDGYWNFSFNKSKEEVGIAAKGTALWALLLYQLYDATGEERHLQAARKALGWLVANQYAGPDPDAYGSVYDCNNNSAVGYRPWFRVSCTYGSAFFGLAVLEELRLQRAQRKTRGH